MLIVDCGGGTGSTVEPKKLRFDFTYGKPLSNDQLLKVEEWINEAALSGGETNVQVRKKRRKRSLVGIEI